MANIELEICTYSYESCLIAQNSGADRVELCSSYRDGGITPSPATISITCQNLSIPVFVMIRPRGGDFLYSNLEYEIMKQDILYAKQHGAKGIVLGLLTPDANIDVQRTSELVALAAPLPVTFHRAFDLVANPFKALEDVISTGCKRILTSGGKPTAPEGLDNLIALKQQAGSRIKIMAGCGITPTNAPLFINSGFEALHFSAKQQQPSPMTYQHPVAISTPLDDYTNISTDSAAIKTMRQLLNSSQRN